MKMKSVVTATGAYGTAVLIGTYLASGNGTTATGVFVGLSVLATVMARRDWRLIAGMTASPSAAGEPSRPAPIRTYEVEQDQSGRIPFYLSDADLFSRAS